MAEISFRPAGLDDEEFLFQLHEAAMRPYVELTFGAWDDAWQRDYFRQHFAPGLLQMIQIRVDDAPPVDVGVLHVQERAEEIFLARIEILPEFQRLGIGTNVIQRLIEESNRRGVPLALKVLKVNVAARGLYQRMGFGVTGENDTHYILAYEPKR